MVWQCDVRGPGVHTVRVLSDGLATFRQASVPPVPPVPPVPHAPPHQHGQVWTWLNQGWPAPKLSAVCQSTHTLSQC